MAPHLPKPKRYLVAAFLLGGALAGIGSAGFSQTQHVISQKGREFTPNAITIRRGETVQIVNDDGDLRHHVYVESDKFRFDSGDQEPGAKANIAFLVDGKFDVLCAIHPKMKLSVVVK
jgi:plastocyanin